MSPKQQLLAAIAEGADLCDLGYQYADVDRRGYCLWVIDCARHVLPLSERHLSKGEMAQLAGAMNSAITFLDGDGNPAAVAEAAAVPRRMANAFCEAHGEIPQHLAESLEAVANAIELVLPDSNVYHEDVIYAAARAALDGQVSGDELADAGDASDCNDANELAGSEESELETQWQLQALKQRLLEGGDILFA